MKIYKGHKLNLLKYEDNKFDIWNFYAECTVCGSNCPGESMKEIINHLQTEGVDEDLNQTCEEIVMEKILG